MYFSYHIEMRKMPGMRGEEDEHPANSNARQLSDHNSLLLSGSMTYIVG